MKTLIANIRQYSGWDSVVAFSKQRDFPGAKGVSVHEVISFFFQEIKRDAINIRAGSVAFSFTLSLFPTLLVIFTLIPYIPIRNFQIILLETINEVMPEEAFGFLQETINDIITRQNSGLLGAGLLLAIYTSSRGVIGMMNSFDKAYPSFRKRKAWNKNLVAFKITGLLFLLLLISVALIIGGELFIRLIMHWIHSEGAATYFWFTLLRFVVIFLVYYVGISLIYVYGPATQKRWKFFNAGSILAAVMSVLVSIIFSWIINQFGQFNKLYGSIGTVIVLMLWIYYNAVTLLIGFELNAAIDVNKHNLLTKSKTAEA